MGNIYQEHFFLKDRTVIYDGSSFEDWWIDAGSTIMNRWAIDMEDVNGPIPIENLLDVPKELNGYSPEMFVKLIQQDGLSCTLTQEGKIFVCFE